MTFCPDYEALLDDLRSISDTKDAQDFSRHNVLGILNVLLSHLGPALSPADSELEDGTVIRQEHAVRTMLRQFTLAFSDLDRGLTDQIFKPIKAGKNRARRWRTRENDRLLIATIDCLLDGGDIKGRKFRSLREVASHLAKPFKAGGWERDGSPLKTEQIVSIYNNHKYQ